MRLVCKRLSTIVWSRFLVLELEVRMDLLFGLGSILYCVGVSLGVLYVAHPVGMCDGRDRCGVALMCVLCLEYRIVFLLLCFYL